MLNAEEIARRVLELEIETERTRIRSFRPEELGVQIAHEMDPRIMEMIRDPLPIEAVEKRIRSFNQGYSGLEGVWTGFAVEDIGSGILFGQVFFNIVSYENQSAEIGYRLHPDFWGRGLGTEAAGALLDFLRDGLEVRKVVAYCVAHNPGSARVLENLGFEREGRLKQHSNLGGKWCDELVFGLVF